MTQSIQEQIRIFPAIESECHLVQVGREMLCADLVPASHDAALQKRERRFDSIGCDASTVLIAHVFPCQMIDGLVFGGPYGVFVGGEAIGYKYLNIRANVFANIFCQRPALGVLGMEEPQIAITLSKANNDFFVGESCTLTAATIFPAHVGFVHFDRPIEHGLIYFLHSCTNAVAEIPRRLVAHSQRALDLVCGHSLARLAKQQCSDKPLLQRQMGVVENCPGGHAELIVSVLAIEQLLFGGKSRSGHLAAWTFDSARPAQAHKNLTALFVSVEQVYNVN